MLSAFTMIILGYMLNTLKCPLIYIKRIFAMYRTHFSRIHLPLAVHCPNFQHQARKMSNWDVWCLRRSHHYCSRKSSILLFAWQKPRE